MAGHETRLEVNESAFDVNCIEMERNATSLNDKYWKSKTRGALTLFLFLTQGLHKLLNSFTVGVFSFMNGSSS